MSEVTHALHAIDDAAKAVGLPAFAERAQVPYSTVAELRSKGWRNRSVEILERLCVAAEAIRNERTA